MDTVLVRVEWDECAPGDGSLPPETVAVPLDIYEDGATRWDDPVSEWLSERFGFLVVDWTAE